MLLVGLKLFWLVVLRLFQLVGLLTLVGRSAIEYLSNLGPMFFLINVNSIMRDVHCMWKAFA